MGQPAKRKTNIPQQTKGRRSQWLTIVLAVMTVICLASYIDTQKVQQTLSLFKTWRTPTSFSPETTYQCLPQSYKTEIISLDPLLIYIHNFFNKQDIQGILQAGENRFVPSQVYKNGVLVQNPYRTSSSAPLPADDATGAVACVLERSRRFLGTMLDASAGDEMGVPQLVRYNAAGQHYDLHHDWMRNPQRAFDGSARSFNRLASFFVVLQDNCTEGETWFPFVGPAAPQREEEEEEEEEEGDKEQGRLEEREKHEEEEKGRVWRKYETGGLAFRPVAGNALFWVNLFPNGTGDSRTAHAGLPVGEGLKTAMNIWPRKYTPDL